MTPETLIHGLRKTYQAGCRCLPCAAANAVYESERARDAALGKQRGVVVDAAKARQHLQSLMAQGVGLHQADALTQQAGRRLSWVYLHSVRSGRRLRILQRTEAVILAIPVKPAGGTTVNSYRARHLIACLIGEDFSMAELARRLGFRLRSRHSPKAPNRLSRITRRKETRIRRFYQLITSEASAEPVPALSWEQQAHAESRKLKGSRTSWKKIESA